MSAADDLDVAEARAALARERLNGTVGALQTKLEPKSLALTARVEAERGGRRAARAAAGHPAVAAGAVALLLGFLARRPIASLARKVVGRRRTAAKPARSQDVSDRPTAPLASNED